MKVVMVALSFALGAIYFEGQSILALGGHGSRLPGRLHD